VGENDRVWRALDALVNDDAVAMGKLMNMSHESSRLNFENSAPEVDEVVAFMQSLPGVLGSRLTGGGFGGGTVSLVRAEAANDVIEKLRNDFAPRRGQESEAFVCRIADGAAVSWE
jgi:galactokinase